MLGTPPPPSRTAPRYQDGRQLSAETDRSTGLFVPFAPFVELICFFEFHRSIIKGFLLHLKIIPQRLRRYGFYAVYKTNVAALR